MAGTADNLLLEVGDPGSATTLDANYTAGDSSISVVSTANWPSTGKGVIFAIDTVTIVDGEEVQDAGSYNEFEGTVTSATSITNVDWVRGAGDTNYTAGSTTRVYIPVSAERENRIVSWGSAEHSEVDGSHTDITADSITVTDVTITGDLTIAGVASDGWTATGGTHSVSTGYNSGNRSFSIATSTDLSGIVSPGMRYRVTRGTTPGTQCTDLESSSSQYASKSSPSGLSFTPTFSAEAWIKLESYTGSQQTIIARKATGTAAGWELAIDSSGRLVIRAGNTAANLDDMTSYQSIPLGEWVHVAGTITMSTSGSTFLWINGVSVPGAFTNGTSTTITQSGNLTLGSTNSPSDYFDGKISDVRVWSDARTDTEIKDNMYIQLQGNESNLVGYWKLDGNFNDSSSNANNLTGQNSAVATATDNPFNATEYGIITKVTASTIQVFCPKGYGIPNGTLSTPYYSTQDAPFGFPRDKGKWSVLWYSRSQISQPSPVSSTYYNVNNQVVLTNLGIGAWDIYGKGGVYVNRAAGDVNVRLTLSTTTATEENRMYTDHSESNNQDDWGVTLNPYRHVDISSTTSYYMKVSMINSGGSLLMLRGDTAALYIEARCAYI